MKDPLEDYLLCHSQRQNEALEWLEHQTHLRTNYPQMLSGALQGELLRLLLSFSGAHKALEIGTFTGYSTIWMASALPCGGIIDTYEKNDELVDLVTEAFRRSGLEDRIRFHQQDFLSAQALESDYDFAYVDADKKQYDAYYEAILPVLRPGGIIAVDDTLWGGKVYADPVPGDPDTRALAAFNDKVAADARVEVVMLPLRHGLTLIRKK